MAGRLYRVVMRFSLQFTQWVIVWSMKLERSLNEESYYERTLDEGAGVLNMGNRDSPSQNFS